MVPFSFGRWLKHNFRIATRRRARASRPRGPRHSRPSVTRLEDRIVPTTHPVLLGTTLPAEGTTVAAAIDHFSATFNEPLDPASATTLANYSLIQAGSNGSFTDTDRTVYPLTPSYTSGSTEVDFTLPTNPLQPGSPGLSARYEFQVNSGLMDPSGNAATPSADPSDTQTFSIVNPPAGQIEQIFLVNSIEGATGLPMTETPAGSGFFTALGVGTFSSAGESDFWHFAAQAGDHVTVRLEAPASLYPGFSLMDAAGNGLASVGGNILPK